LEIGPTFYLLSGRLFSEIAMRTTTCSFHAVLLAAMFAVSLCAEDAKVDAKNAERPGWVLKWSDEFDVDGEPDSKKWGREVGFIRNGELQYYTQNRPENARVEKGVLIIEGRKEKFTNPKFQEGAKGDWNKTKSHADYTAASLTTSKSASWTYGRIEVRAKLPAGRGTWPAIWMLGTNINEPGVGWPKCGEIDIMEFVGYDPEGMHATVHTTAYNHVKKTSKGHREKVEKLTEDFHVFAVEWTEKEIAFLFDDRKIHSFENDGKGDVATWPFNKPQYLILNFAIGGGWGAVKGIDETIFPQKFLIDYVRVYQRPDEQKK
jgi:beta-glucanase (GH16 family)